jgi:hypothetical protein
MFNFKPKILKEKIIFLRYAVIISFVLISCFQFNEIDYAQSNPVAQNLSFSQNFETTTFTETPTGMAAWTVKSSPKGNQSSAKLSTTNGDALITAAQLRHLRIHVKIPEVSPKPACIKCNTWKKTSP